MNRPCPTTNVGTNVSRADILCHAPDDPVTSDSIRMMSCSMPRMSASISYSGRGGL